MRNDHHDTSIDGEDCQVEICYRPGTNRLITSASLEPNDPEEFEIVGVNDPEGNPWPALQQKMTEDDELRIYHEFKRSL